jgi:hypothetical protein
VAVDDHAAVNPERVTALSEVNFNSRLPPDDCTFAGVDKPETPFIKSVEVVDGPSYMYSLS